MGERHEAFQIANALDRGDGNSVLLHLQNDSQFMNGDDFRNTLTMANQFRRNPNSDQLQMDSINGLPAVDLININGGIDQQIQLNSAPAGGGDQPPPPYFQNQQDQPPPPPEYYPNNQQPPQYYSEQPPPQYDQGPPPGYYDQQESEQPGQCAGRTIVGGIAGALIGRAIVGRRNGGAGALLGALGGAALGNNSCQ